MATLKQARRRLGLTLADLAIEAGVSIPTIHTWENTWEHNRLSVLKTQRYMTALKNAFTKRMKALDNSGDHAHLGDIMGTDNDTSSHH